MPAVSRAIHDWTAKKMAIVHKTSTFGGLARVGHSPLGSLVAG